MMYTLKKGDSADVTLFGPLRLTLIVNSHGELYDSIVAGENSALPVNLREGQAYINTILTRAGLSTSARTLLNHIWDAWETRFQALIRY